MKRKLVGLFIVLTMLVTIFAGCSGSTPGTSATTSEGTAKGDDTIRIGVMTILTGDKANIGFSERDGALMAMKDINEAGGILGKKVEVFFGDTVANPTEGVNALRKLLTQDKVDFVIGPGQSGTTIACASMINEAKIPMIASTATNPKATVVDGKVNPYVWRMAFIDPYQGKVIADYSVNKLGKKKAVILYDVGSDYAIGLNQYFEEAYAKAGGTIVAKMAYKTGDVDFRSQLSELKSKDFDMILLPNNYKDIALIVNQMAELGITGKQIMCGDSGMSLKLIEMAGENFEGAYIVSYFSVQQPEIAAFIERYIKEYNLKDTPEPNCVLEYDLMYWAKDVIERAGSLEGEKLQKAINETKDLKLIHGSVTIDPETHDPLDKPAAMLHVENSKQVFKELFVPGQ